MEKKSDTAPNPQLTDAEAARKARLMERLREADRVAGPRSRLDAVRAALAVLPPEIRALITTEADE